MSTIADEILRLDAAKKSMATAVNTKLSQVGATTFDEIGVKYSDLAAEIDRIPTEVTELGDTIGTNITLTKAYVINDLRMYNKTYGTAKTFNDLHFYRIDLYPLFTTLKNTNAAGTQKWAPNSTTVTRAVRFNKMKSLKYDGYVNFIKKENGQWTGSELFYDSSCCCLSWWGDTKGVSAIKCCPGMLFQQFGLCRETTNAVTYGSSIITELIESSIVDNSVIFTAPYEVHFYFMSVEPLTFGQNGAGGLYAVSPWPLTRPNDTNWPTDISSWHTPIQMKDRDANTVTYYLYDYDDAKCIEEVSYETFEHIMEIANA